MRHLILIPALLALTACEKKIVIKQAKIVERGEKIKLSIALSRADGMFLIENNYIIYLGAGDCTNEDLVEFQSIEFQGQRLPNTSLRLAKEGGDLTFTAPVASTPRTDACAHLKVTSMFPNGARSDPVKITQLRP